MGWEGEGGRCGEYDGECLFDDDRDEDEYEEDKKNVDVEDGMGCTGERTSGGNPIQCCNVVHGLSFGGVGQKMLIVVPQAAAAIINNEDDCHCRGGHRASPLSGPSRPAGRCLLLLMLLTTVSGDGTRTFGAWEEGLCHCTHSLGSDQT
jgi:hypothetical protein